jgi:ATP-dependent Clp endopeptidase proteolytic subunit ClpP
MYKNYAIILKCFLKSKDFQMQNGYQIITGSNTSHQKGEAEILLYGYIGNQSNDFSKNFINDFKKVEATNSQINVRINSGGGDVFEGITIYNTLKNSTATVHVYVDGIAASMASIIALGGSKIFMSKYAQLMIHKVSGNANGDADKLRETANLMDELEKSLTAIYAERTGLSIENVQSDWMQRGKDNWFNAEAALENKLVDEIFDGSIKKSPTKIKNEQDAWQFYNTQIQNNLNSINMEVLSPMISFFKLAANATDVDVMNAIQTQAKQNADLVVANEKLQIENTNFQALLAASQKQKVKDLIDTAIQAKQITEEHRTSFTALAEANYDATKVAINAIKPYQSISGQLVTDEATTEYKTFSEYQKNAPELLAEMKTSNPAKFTALYKKEFGKTPHLISL